MRGPSKEARVLMREARHLGFEYVRTSRHSILMRDKRGRTIGITLTPGDKRAIKNIRANLAKMART